MRILLVAVAVVVAGCSSSAATSSGGERSVCEADGDCDTGLECWSQRCVRPEGADCRAVAERLASLKMGNYATREEREPEVRRWVTACEGERLTRKEGRCIIEAPTEDDIAACARPLVPELVGDPKGCEQIGEKAAELLDSADGQLRPIVNVIDQVPEAVKKLCVDGRWSAEAKSCLREAASYRDAEPCLKMLDGADRRALERRFTALVKLGMAKGAPPPRQTGIPSDCKRFTRLMKAYGSCPQMPPDVQSAMESATRQMEEAWLKGSPAERKQMAEGCRQGIAAMHDAMKQMGCNPPPEDPWE